MQLPAKQALVCWVSFMVLIIGALMVFLGPPASKDGAAESIGHVVALTGFAALGSWLLARRKTPPWSWGKFVLVYMASVIVVAALAAYGNRSYAAERQSFPFIVSHSSDWKVERLEGVSSSPSDHDLGVREQAVLVGREDRAMISLICAWRKINDQPDLDNELAQIVNGVTEGLHAHKLDVQSTDPQAASIGGHPGLITELHASKGEQLLLTQLIAVTTSDRCFVSVALAASRVNSAHRQEFERIRREIVFN